MQDVNVLILFQSRGEEIERLALAAAVGAVQGRANIRLRCLEAVDNEFIAPRDSDASWADAIIAVLSDAPADGLKRYFDSLDALGAREKLTIAEWSSEPDALTAARLRGRRVADAARSLRNGPA